MSTTDDWKIDVEPAEKHPIPSFIRLFVINRILQPHVLQETQNDTASQKKVVIRSLVSVFENKKDEEAAFAVLDSLIENGIKKYMNNCFNLTRHANTVEEIHNQLILTKFSQEYVNTTKYTANDGRHYQSLVFNTDDLMCSIFQFLRHRLTKAEVNDDLINCCLINSYWLYHVFNPNSLYQLHLSTLVNSWTNTIDGTKDRLWQRVIKAKKMKFRTARRKQSIRQEPNDKLLSKVSMLGNIEDIYFRSGQENVCILKALMQQCRKNITNFDVAISTRNTAENVLSPLVLPNAEYVSIRNKYFNIIWSNKCEKMRWFMLSDISKNWCQFLIDKCDCSGIKHLILDDIAFDRSINSTDNRDGSGDEIFSLVANQFINLEKLNVIIELVDYKAQIGLLWQGLKPIIDKNNTYVTLKLVKSSVTDELVTFINDKNIKINRIESKLYSIEFIQLLFDIIDTRQDLQSIKFFARRRHTCDDLLPKFLIKLQQMALTKQIQREKNRETKPKDDDVDDESKDNQTSIGDGDGIYMASLGAIEIDEILSQRAIGVLNDLLRVKFFLQRKIFLIIKLNVEIDETLALWFLSKFEQFCQLVYSLMIEEQMAVQIVVKFEWQEGVAVDHTAVEKMHDIFDAVFDEKVVNLSTDFKLKQEQCNKCCVNMEKPTISLINVEGEKFHVEFCAVNAFEVEV